MRIAGRVFTVAALISVFGFGQILPKATIVRLVGLNYPRLAHLADVEGQVQLIGTISTNGTLSNMRVTVGHDLLLTPVKDAVSKWVFACPTASLTQCEVMITFIFELEKGTCEISSCLTTFEVDLPDTVHVRSKHARAIVN